MADTALDGGDVPGAQHSFAFIELEVDFSIQHMKRLFLALVVLAMIVLGWAVDGTRCGQSVTAGGNASAVPSSIGIQTGSSRSHPDSGIYGHMVTAWGNPPAEPPTYECVRVLDPTRQRVVAKGTCSGLWGEFRIPLEPGQYIVEAGGG